MIASPLVSIVVPCYNVEQWVESTLESALAQTHAEIEVICVDDGSEDGTVEILARVEAADPRVRVVEGEHAGSQAARNRGLAEARGSFVQFLDADDLIHPDKIEHQVRLATVEMPPADIIAGAFRRIQDGRKHSKERSVGTDPWSAIACSQMGVTSANLFHRKAVEDVGGWSGTWGSSQEYELMFRMLKKGARVVFDPEVRTTKRDRPGSISYAYDIPIRESYLQLCGQVLDHLRQTNTLTSAREHAIAESVFYRIRALYPLDAQTAIRYHRELVPPHYVPESGGTNTQLYVTIYRLLGFHWAERLRHFKPSRLALGTSGAS